MRWRPAHEAHAIERVSVLLQFSESLGGKPWQALINAASQALPQQGFNTTVEEFAFPQLPALGAQPQVAQLSIGPGGIVFGQNGVPAGGTQGRLFQVIDQGGVREEVSISRSRFAFSATNYDSWVIFKDRLLGLLEPYLTMAFLITNIPVIKLEYWDRFVFTGSPEDASYAEVLNATSRYLPSFAFESSELWHSHTGRFVPSDSRAKRLINLNADVVDVLEAQVDGSAAHRRSVGVYTMAQDAFSADDAISETSDLTSTLEALHTILKDVFSDVITKEAADRVSLYPRDRT